MNSNTSQSLELARSRRDATALTTLPAVSPGLQARTVNTVTVSLNIGSRDDNRRKRLSNNNNNNNNKLLQPIQYMSVVSQTLSDRPPATPTSPQPRTTTTTTTTTAAATTTTTHTCMGAPLPRGRDRPLCDLQTGASDSPELEHPSSQTFPCPVSHSPP